MRMPEFETFEETPEALPLTKKNAVLSRSENGLLSLTLRKEDGQESFYERVVPVCAFPLTEPDEFISLREPDTPRRASKGEIGYLRHIGDLGEEAEQLLRAELGRRYFTPELTKIYTAKDKYGFFYWDAQTSAGRVQMTLTNPGTNIRTLEDGRVLITDIDGNVYMISDPSALDRATSRILTVFL